VQCVGACTTAVATRSSFRIFSRGINIDAATATAIAATAFIQGSRVVNSIANYFGRKGVRAAKDGDRDIDDGVISFDDGESLYYCSSS
jgi:hypothetical protein